MKIIILGAPGSGKGTQAAYLTRRLEVPKISTGDMLRAVISANTILGKKVKAILASGELVSDDIILALVKERLAAADCERGFLFDGFPRTIVQAEGLWQAGIDVDCIIDINVPDQEIIKRLSGRLVHLSSGRIYHTEFNPPKIAGLDDETGESLVQREDDKKEVVVQRLKVYHEQTEPLAAWYQSENYFGAAKYIQISGLKQVNEIAEDILNCISEFFTVTKKQIH